MNCEFYLPITSQLIENIIGAFAGVWETRAVKWRMTTVAKAGCSLYNLQWAFTTVACQTVQT